MSLTQLWFLFCQIVNGQIKCPYGIHQQHNTPDQQFWMKSRMALRRHLSVHHQIIIRNIAQPDDSRLDMLLVPTVAELRGEIKRCWKPRVNEAGHVYPPPSEIPGELPVDIRSFPVPLMSLNTRPCPIMSIQIRPPTPSTSQRPSSPSSSPPAKRSCHRRPAGDESSTSYSPPTSPSEASTILDPQSPTQQSRYDFLTHTLPTPQPVPPHSTTADNFSQTTSPPWSPPFSLSEVLPVIYRLLVQYPVSPPHTITELTMTELFLPPTDLSSRNFIAGIVYVTCALIRYLTNLLSQTSTLGLQLDPLTGFTAIHLIAQTLSVMASRPSDPMYPVNNFPALLPPPTHLNPE